MVLFLKARTTRVSTLAKTVKALLGQKSGKKKQKAALPRYG
jgi:hypothetical protein